MVADPNAPLVAFSGGGRPPPAAGRSHLSRPLDLYFERRHQLAREAQDGLWRAAPHKNASFAEERPLLRLRPQCRLPPGVVDDIQAEAVHLAGTLLDGVPVAAADLGAAAVPAGPGCTRRGPRRSCCPEWSTAPAAQRACPMVRSNSRTSVSPDRFAPVSGETTWVVRRVAARCDERLALGSARLKDGEPRGARAESSTMSLRRSTWGGNGAARLAGDTAWRGSASLESSFTRPMSPEGSCPRRSDNG